MKKFFLTITTLILAACINCAWGQLVFENTGSQAVKVHIQTSCRCLVSGLSFEYSTDGVNWYNWNVPERAYQITTQTFTQKNSEISIPVNGKLYVRGNNERGLNFQNSGLFGGPYNQTTKFVVTEGASDLKVSGNLIDLLGVNTAPANSFKSFFDGCKSIKEVELSGYSYLADNSCDNLFNNCTNLNYVSVDFTNWVSGATDAWLNGVSHSGTFVGPKSLLDEIEADSKLNRGANTIPAAWNLTTIAKFRVDNNSKRFVSNITKESGIRVGETVTFDVACQGYVIKGVEAKDSKNNIVAVTRGDGDKYSVVFGEYDITVFVDADEIEYDVETDLLVDGISKTPKDGISVNKNVLTISNNIATFTALDKKGYTLTSVYVNGRGASLISIDGGRQVLIDIKDYYEDILIKANYETAFYDIILADACKDYTSVADNKTKAKYQENVTVNVESIPLGYRFDGIRVDNKTNGKVVLRESDYKPSYTFSMPDDNVAIVVNRPAIQYPVEYMGDFNATGFSKVVISDNFEFTVVDKSSTGETVDYIKINGKEQNVQKTSNDYKIGVRQFVVADNNIKKFTIEVAYKKADYQITVNPESAAFVTASNAASNKNMEGGLLEARYGDNINFSVADRTTDGYDLTSVTRNGDVITSSLPLENWSMIADNVAFVVKYTPHEYDLEYNGTGYTNNSGSTVNVTENIEFTLQDRSADGLEIDKIFVNGLPFTNFSKSDNNVKIPASNYLASIVSNKKAVVKIEWKKTEFNIETATEPASIGGIEFSNKSRPAVVTAQKGEAVSIEFANKESEGYRFNRASYSVKKESRDYPLSVGSGLKAEIAPMPASDIKIVAEYDPITYNVTYSSNQGVGNITGPATAIVTDVIEYDIDNKEVSEGLDIDFIKVTKKSDNSSVTLGSRNYSGKIAMSSYIDNIEIYVSYKLKDFSISSDKYTFVKNTTQSLSGNTDVVSAHYNDNIEVSAYDRTLDGYNFESVTFDSRDGDQPVACTKVGDVYKGSFLMPAKNIKVTTNYSEIVYNVTYKGHIDDGNGLKDADGLIAGATTATATKGITYTLLSMPGYAPYKLEINGNDVPVSNGFYSLQKPLQDVAFEVWYKVKDYDIIADEPEINTITKNGVGVSSPATARYEDKITFRIGERKGYELKSVVVKGLATNNTLTAVSGVYSFTMPAENVNIVANFELKSKPVVYNGGNFTFKGMDKVTMNDLIQFGAKEIPGKQLNQVTVGGKPVYLTQTNTFAVNANEFVKDDKIVDIQVVLSYIDLLHVTTNDDNITVNKEWVANGESVNYTVVQKPGYASALAISGTCNKPSEYASSTSGTISDIKSDISLSVEYTAGKFMVVSKDGFYEAYATAQEVTCGQNVNPSPKDRTSEGYKFVTGTCNGKEIPSGGFTMPAENVILVAYYEPIAFSVKTEVSTSGGGSVTTASATATIFDYVDFEATPADGKKIANVTVNYGTGNNDDITSSVSEDGRGRIFMSKYKHNITITVTFSDADQYEIFSADGYAAPQVDKSVAGATIGVTFENRLSEGMEFVSATYNGKTIKKDASGNYSFIMPAEEVVIITYYKSAKYNITVAAESQQYLSVARTPLSYNETAIIFINLSEIPEGKEIDKIYIQKKFKDGTCNGSKFALDGQFVSEARILMSEIASDFELSVELKEVNYFTLQEGDHIVSLDKTAKVTLSDAITYVAENRVLEGYKLVKITAAGIDVAGSSYTGTFKMSEFFNDNTDPKTIKVSAVYEPLAFVIKTDGFSTAKLDNKEVAEAETGALISVELADRAANGYELKTVTLNGKDLTFNNYAATFTMPAEDVVIATIYDAVSYTVTTDEYSEADMDYAGPMDSVHVAFEDRTLEGYRLDKILVNGIILPSADYQTAIYMGDYLTDISIEAVYAIRDYEIAVEEISVNAGGYCAGSDAEIVFSSSQMALEYRISFSQEALNAGFSNTGYETITSHSGQEVLIEMPDGVEYGTFAGYVSVRDRFGNESHDYEFKLQVSYPSDLIMTKLSDMVFVDNHNHDYIGYQWLKDGVEILGANKQFYIDAPVLKGAYGLILTMQNGEKRRVCDLVANNTVAKTAIRPVNVYPNPARSYEDITVELGDLGDEELAAAVIVVYNQTGTVAARITDAGGLNTLNLPEGAYTGVVSFCSHKMTFKFIVTE